MRFYAVFLSIALTCFGVFAASEAIESRFIRIDGSITANTLFEISQKLAGWSNEDPVPAGLIVLLNSQGGDGEAAMQIGRVLRQKKAQVFVTGRCESACVFILASGVVRAAAPGSVGVHAGRLTLTDRQGKVLKEIDASRSLDDSFRLTHFNSEVRQYFAEMGIEHGLLDVVLAHRTMQTYKLTDLEMKQYRLVGFDSQYLRERSLLFEKGSGSERINRMAFYDRTLSVPMRCKASASNNDAFLVCFKNLLFNGQPNKSSKLFR